VVAPGLVPQRPGDRVKTDPRDARKLARLLAGGLLQPIHVPSPELEAARDLVRAREDARLDRMRDRQRLSKFCLRHGRLLPTSAWTVTRRKWLGEQRFEHAAEQITFDSYLHAIDLVDARAWTLTAANRNDVTQLLELLDRVPPVRGRPGRPRRRPQTVLADRGYDHDKYRRPVWQRGVKPIIARRQTQHGSGLGRNRWVVERTFAWLHNRRRLLLRTDRLDDIHEGFLALACCLICWRRLETSLS
jgi:transposase